MTPTKKTTLTVTVAFLFLSCIFYSCVVSNPKLFANVESSIDSTYGYTDMNPLLIKNGDMYSSMETENYFLQRLTTVNGERLVYVSRSSVDNPKYHSTGVENRITKQAVGGGGPILDKYTFVIENRTDTIKLYVNVYKKGTIAVPVGLKYNP